MSHLSKYQTDGERWAAVSGRERAADGQFVFSVRSTGVYCRPGCASRTPRRENVSFHTDWRAAEAAGFRPCKRCAPAETSADEPILNLIRDVCRRIDGAETPPTLAELADAAGLSRFHFHRLFKRIVGVTPRAYVRTRQLERLRIALAADVAGRPGETAGITSAIYEAGFGSSSRAYAMVNGGLGMTPSALRAGGAGERIRYGIATTRLGTLLVARTSRGICAIEFGDDAAAIKAQLARRFPQASLVADDEPEADTALRAVARYVDDANGERSLSLPLDIVGTAFQRRVWEALTKIPVGETATYAELAANVGNPSAVRAVAAACAANPVALAVPCHRAVRSDGGLGGYRWGLARKRALLERESVLARRDREDDAIAGDGAQSRSASDAGARSEKRAGRRAVRIQS